MTEPDFLELDVVLFLHDQALREYGGMHGIRSEDLLQSALARPINRFAYAETDTLDLFDLAAAYAFGVAANHPFNDGNKRTAWSSCRTFLKTNACVIRFDALDAIGRMVRLASGAIEEAAFAAWLRTLIREGP